MTDPVFTPPDRPGPVAWNLAISVGGALIMALLLIYMGAAWPLAIALGLIAGLAAYLIVRYVVRQGRP